MMETGFIDYTHCLKLGEWEQSKVIQLFAQPDNDKLLELIESNRNSGKLEYSRSTGGGYSDVPRKYFYDPLTVVSWAKAKGLALPIELIEWVQVTKPSSDVPIQSEEKPQNESERQKMLKLILGMAMELGYNPDTDAKQPITGNKNGISAKIKKHGINVTDETILKYLTEAKNLK
jgi:hypothetical protein